MRRREVGLPGVCILEPRIFDDHRGRFFESYSRRVLADLGIGEEFVQDNHSHSREGVIRGLHYQIEHTQTKLVRVVRGTVLDVCVDVRFGSPTFGRWCAAELSEGNQSILYIPAGFAHGFCVTQGPADLCYKCSDYYTPTHERGIAWDDAAIGIAWPLAREQAIVSIKDAAYPCLAVVDPSDLPKYAGTVA